MIWTPFLGHKKRGFYMSKLTYEDKINLYVDRKSGMAVHSVSKKYNIISKHSEKCGIDGEVSERSIVRSWKGRVLKGTAGSNPVLSAKLRRLLRAETEKRSRIASLFFFVNFAAPALCSGMRAPTAWRFALLRYSVALCAPYKSLFLRHKTQYIVVLKKIHNILCFYFFSFSGNL